MARTGKPEKTDHALIESGLQEEGQEWAARVLESVKDAEPSTKDDRAHSALRRRVPSRISEGETKRRDTKPAGFEVCQVPSITVHPDPEDSVVLDEDVSFIVHPKEGQGSDCPGSCRRNVAEESARADSSEGSPVSRSPSTAIGSPTASMRESCATAVEVDEQNTESERRRMEQNTESCATAVDVTVGSPCVEVDEQNTESLVAVFRMLLDDGEVHVDSLPHALDLIGAHRMPQWLEETLQSITRHTTLDLKEFITFVQAYKRRQSLEIATAFHEIDVDGSGSIDTTELTALLAKLGMGAMDVVIGEILEEVDMNNNGTVEQNEFESLWILLEKREGFSKREYDRLLGTFCRFDTDHSGSIDKDEVTAILNYFNYSLQRIQVHRIFDEVSKSGNGELNETEYLMFMRKVRESEINAMTDWLLSERFTTKKLVLIRLLIFLGYLPDDDTLIECAQAAGISLDQETPDTAEDTLSAGSAPPVVSIKEAWRFLELYRIREGMTNAELEDNKEIWNGQPDGESADALGEREIDTVNAQKALLLLGWDAPLEVQQQLMYDVDIDRSGGISLVEFQKLVRMYRDREATSIISVCDEYELPVSDCLHPVLKEAAVPVLQALGVSYATTEDIPTAQNPRAADKCSSPFARQNSALRPSPSEVSSQPAVPAARQTSADSMAGVTDIYSIFSVVRPHRREIRKTYRDHEGFGPDAMQDLETLWSEATGAQSVNEGYRSVAQAGDNAVTFRLLKQLESAIPEPVFQEMELLEAVREIEINGLSSTFDFLALVRMMRKAHDTRLHKLVEREAAAVAETGCSNDEVRDFRKVFIQYDPAGTDRLAFEDLKRIFERIAPVGTGLAPQLKLIWKKWVMFQSEDMTVDFPDFLRIMKECMDCDLISISSAPQNGTRRLSAARALANNVQIQSDHHSGRAT
jgi:Ca2+-binding EF-hand superfamily protein